MAIAVAAALALPAAAAAATPRPGTKVSRPVHSLAPDGRAVKESFVRVYSPLPASFGAHPAACDWISYLRFRDADGPRNPSKADAVIVLIPGFLGGAADFDQVARNTIRDGAARGKHLEVWALDRRSNCLEDNRGVEAAAKAHDPAVAYHYYWGGQPVDGHRFAGWVTPQAAAWENHLGLAQTLRDWYTVLRTGIPSERVRKRKVLCGGHSMGGPMTAAFASFDFDGNPATTKDAGYNQCAGFIGLDTVLRLQSLP